MNLNEKIEAINARLMAGEPGNISRDEYAGVSAYGAQATFDAVNAEILGNWRYEVSAPTIHEKEVVVTVTLFLREDGGGWIALGSSAGGGQPGRGSLADAIKAATSDGLKKVLAVCLGVGSRAYRGELPDPTKPTAAPAAGGENEAAIRGLLREKKLTKVQLQEFQRELGFHRETATPEAWKVLRQACEAAVK